MSKGSSPSPIIAFRHRNFRLLWTGQLISMAGSMMQSAALLWHVSLLVPAGQRGLALGMVGLVRIVPIQRCDISESTARRARASAPRLWSCVATASIACGKLAARRRHFAWNWSIVSANSPGSEPTSLREISRP